jgi:hypothetical protein
MSVTESKRVRFRHSARFSLAIRQIGYRRLAPHTCLVF